jgi:hypothetical protein
MNILSRGVPTIQKVSILMSAHEAQQVAFARLTVRVFIALLAIDILWETEESIQRKRREHCSCSDQPDNRIRQTHSHYLRCRILGVQPGGSGLLQRLGRQSLASLQKFPSSKRGVHLKKKQPRSLRSVQRHSQSRGSVMRFLLLEQRRTAW